MNETQVFDHRVCGLGEGIFWHPLRQQLFWFDIVGKTLLSQDKDNTPLSWKFTEFVSCAGWLDMDNLLIASETRLFKFNLTSGNEETVSHFEANNPVTRSNDGRADPWGGFWIGSMGKKAEYQAGAIYRYYKGELRKLYPSITISNAICFCPNQRYAYFSDTLTGIIWRQLLTEKDGWPTGDPEIFVDCRDEKLWPDGAVVDSLGRLWNAQWGASRIACYNEFGHLLHSFNYPVTQVSCPAFGGTTLSTLFVTSATQDLTPKELYLQPKAGQTFNTESRTTGQKEFQIIL